jgi:CO/xanthine dehydrogenase FAD-binding subunit
MKPFTNANAKDLAHAATMVRQALSGNRAVAIASGGSDLLGMMKERLVAPDVVVSLRTVKGLDQVKPNRDGSVTLGGQITLDR